MPHKDWRSLPLNALRAFEAAARHESFARAATELNVTPAAVSQHVKALEQRVDLDLFRRHPQGIVLTNEGRTLLPTVQRSFGLISDALVEARERRTEPTVTINAVGVFARAWLLPRLAKLRTENPKIEVRVFTHNNRKVEELPSADLYVRYGKGGWPGWEEQRLIRADVTPMCSPEVARSLQAPDQLLAFPLFSTYHSEEWAGWFELAGVHAVPRVAATFDSSAVMIGAAMDGLGVAISAPSLFQSDLKAGRICCPFEQVLPISSSYYLSRRTDASRTLAANQVWKWLGAQADV